MKKSPSAPLKEGGAVCDEAFESLVSMRSQDANHYRCRDYLGRRRRRASEFANETSQTLSPEEEVDEECRRKMVEWTYSICDFISFSRDLVAFTFSILDRFSDRCSTDRTAFKLAAVTSLYISNKLLNGNSISIKSLAELSRGEFEQQHIQEMELIILETVEWRLSPPTVQSFIRHLRKAFPSAEASIIDEIYEHAIFFAELSVYDYTLVTEERYLLAAACTLNAIEGVEDTNQADELERECLLTLDEHVPVDLDPDLLTKMREKLWCLYGCSAQTQFDDIMSNHYSRQERLVKQSVVFDGYNSPVSVNQIGWHRTG
jgi:hypothetical protein